MLLHAVGEGEAELGVGFQFFGQTERHFVGAVHGIVVQIEQHVFAVPDEVAERAGRRAAPDGVPVLDFAPVMIAGVIVEQEVVDVFGEIELLSDFFEL